MRKLTTTQKLTVALAAGAVGVAGSGIAYAYWTTTGSGTGSASTTTDVAADKLQITQDASTLTGFYPGGPAQNVAVTVKNPALFAQKAGNVTVTVADAGLCLAGNWEIVDKTAVEEAIAQLAPNATSPSTVVATIALKETNANQDSCKTKSPVLTFSSAPGA